LKSTAFPTETITLTSDVDHQSHESYGHVTHTQKVNVKGYSFQKLEWKQ